MDWPVLETPRLRLRGWREEDRELFAAMHADPEVMRYFPAPLTPDESDALWNRNQEHFARHGFGLWAVEVKRSGGFAGAIGLTIPSFDAHFTPCVEIGWKLATEYWGRGLASEGAEAALHYAFAKLGLEEVVAFAALSNDASRSVMERIGMTYDPSGDFDHPRLPPGHWLRRHMLYRKRRRP